MSGDFPCLVTQRKSGSEQFRYEGKDAGFDLLDFWQWSVSDLVSNATRGILAEYIVAKALGVAKGIRNEWDAFDLRTASGIKVEVKSAAYVQSWYQKKLSLITFVVPPTRAFDPIKGIVDREPKRQADVYVFALLKHQEKPSIDPMNLDQWEFYALPVSVLNERKRSQYSITLKSLKAYCPAPVQFADLAGTILRVGGSLKEADKTPT
jgi:hypothetical protein